jgi:FMN phosphatase YigB (HAD superfamily)/DNA-binding XRE family transcriptional regulator
MDEKGLGKRLQEMRRKAGLTQQQLCQTANLSFSTLTKIERGAIKAPSIFTIASIAKALGLGLDELLGNNPKIATKGKQTRSGARFIFFDVNGCLVRFYHRAFAQIANDYGVPPDLVEMAFLHYNADVCRGSLSMHDFNRIIAKRLGVPSLDWEKYYLSAVEPMPGMDQVVSWASQNYQIGLLTNIMPGQLKALRQSMIIPNLEYDVIVDSSEVGLIKPEAEIFELAQSKTGLAAEDLLLIDDTRENVAQAESMGWHVLWFDYAQPDESVEQVKMALDMFSS